MKKNQAAALARPRIHDSCIRVLIKVIVGLLIGLLVGLLIGLFIGHLIGLLSSWRCRVDVRRQA